MVDAILEDEEEVKPFENLDLRSARCFGFQAPISTCWTALAKQADDLGWQQIDHEQLERSLAKDVDNSYFHIASFKLVNLDDDTKYVLWFDNNKALWSLEIEDSPKAELEIEERANFFKSEMFKKIAKQAYTRVVDAQEAYDKTVRSHLESGELLLVDVVKLDAILHFLRSQHFLDNLLNGKYLSY